jgi:hypothetical protein
MMTWDQFAECLREEGFGSEDEIKDYIAELQEYPEHVQRILLSDN